MNAAHAVGRREGVAFLVALGIASMGLAVGNQWAQDDVELIAGNPAVQAWSGLWTGFVSPWWPPPWTSGLYRPLARALLTVEWHLGGGAPWVIHATSLLLYLAAILAVWRCAERIFPSGIAWAAVALLAVHPVHVEAVALGVNQGELVVAALAATALAALLDLRSGRIGAGRGWSLIAGSTLIALLFKEHAAVIPLLLVLADLLLPVPEGGASLRHRTAGYVGLLALVALFIVVRGFVLGGVVGAPAAAGLAAGSFSGRALTMLGVVPDIVRLLLWPAHLQADYSPMESIPWGAWTIRQTLGGLAVVIGAAGFLANVRRRPMLAFGLGWIAISLLPVSNLLVPTGLFLAERTLFLPSVGLVFIAGVALNEIRARSDSPRQRAAALVIGAVVLSVATVRSAIRMPVWHDQATHVTAQLMDAPESYRAHMAFGMLRWEAARDRVGGELHLREAVRLSPGDPEPFKELGDRYRHDGLCAPALDMYGRALRLVPGRDDLRLGFVECLLRTGAWAGAAAAARDPAIQSGDKKYFEGVARMADSLGRIGARPGPITMPPLPGARGRS